MGVRTIRLDPESERLLAEVRRRTGMNVSQALKAGLNAVHAAVRNEAAAYPYAIYASLDLGAGGYARAPASAAKRAVRERIRRKFGR